MSSFLDKMSNFFFKNDDIEIEEETPQFNNTSRTSTINNSSSNDFDRTAAAKKAKKSNLITVPAKKHTEENLEIVLFKATSYDDMQEIARHIKERKVAVVNFEDMDKDTAQRMVDFLSGAVFALDGVPRKVSGGTFIFSCSQVDMTGKIMEKDSGFDAEYFEEDSRFSSNQWLRS